MSSIDRGCRISGKGLAKGEMEGVMLYHNFILLLRYKEFARENRQELPSDLNDKQFIYYRGTVYVYVLR